MSKKLLKTKSNIKYLRIFIDSDLTVNYHVSYVFKNLYIDWLFASL